MDSVRTSKLSHMFPVVP